MNRRGFFGLLAGAAVAPLIPIPELDVGRVHFLPPPGGWVRSSGNMLLTPAQITREALRILTVTGVFTADIHREYDPEFARVTLRTDNRIRVGDRITIQGLT